MERLCHIIDSLIADGSLKELDMKHVNKIIKAMQADIYREAKGEIVETKEVRKTIGKKTVKLFKQRLMET